MPGFFLHVGSVVQCAHGGQAQPTVPNPRVLVSGQPTVAIGAPWVVAGCPFVPPANGPDVTANFITSAVRVTSNGQPLLLLDSVAVCAPSGAPALVVVTQTRAMGT